MSPNNFHSLDESKWSVEDLIRKIDHQEDMNLVNHVGRVLSLWEMVIEPK